MALLSIIIPCYNVEQYLEKCIGSVYDQKLNESEFELIIINDGSTDQSVSIAMELVRNKSNTKIISQENKGLGGARNTGILNATGVYLLFLDADDWLLPNIIPSILPIATENQLDLLEFSAQGVNSAGKIRYHFSNRSAVFSSGCEYYNNIRYMNSSCNKLYRREFLIENNIFFLERIYIEDFEFNTRCLIKSKKILATDLLVCQFLQSENSITRNTDDTKKKKMISDIIFVIERTRNLYQDHPSTQQSTLFFLERLNFLVATLFFQLVKNKATYKEIQSLKSTLQEQNLFYVNHKIYDSRKNMFRVVFLKKIWLYQLIKWFY